MPILILKAPGLKSVGMKPRVGQFDYLKYAMEMAGRQNQVTIQLIEGTDHSFANRVGRIGVEREMENWLEKHFPVASLEGKDQGEGSQEIGFGAQNNSGKPQRVFAHAGYALKGR